MKTLLPHQIEDARFLASRKVAGNFSGMGSGKTLTALAGGRLVSAERTIVVAPPIALAMWAHEAENEVGLSTQIITAGKTKIDTDVDIIITSYALATKRVAELKALQADVLILDESHALKNVSAKRTRAMLGRGGLCESVKHTWFLTGTPVTRWNDDLFPFLVRAANGSLRETIGGMSMDRFQLRYCVTQLKKFHSRQQRPIKVVVGNRNTVELNKMLFDGSSPLAVRRELKEVWAAMPPITKTRLYVTPTRSDELSTAMQALAKMSQRQIEQAIGNNDESLARTRRLLGEAKVDASVSEIVDRVESSDSGILVLAWHRSVIDALVSALEDKGVTVSKIDGGTPAHQKQSAQVDFNSGNIQVLVGQIAAMGTAIDLQHGGHNIIVVEEDWSPAVMDQAYARLHRMGQANHVSAEILSTDTKLDKALSRIASNKSREHSNLLEQNND